MFYKPNYANKYDLIISNPPYINKVDLNRLDDDVRLYEPKLALYGGITGLEEINKIIENSSKLLKYNGKMIIEIGNKQKNYARNMQNHLKLAIFASK